jgi:hypothetical protein
VSDTNDPLLDETIEELQERLQKKELRSKIAKKDEKVLRGKIVTAVSGVSSFVIVSFLFFHYLFVTTKSDYNVSAILSLIAGSFAAFLIMMISGMIREFSIKSPIFEMTSKLEEKIKEVQTDVTQSTKDINDKIQSMIRFSQLTILLAINLM